jgi:HlyD family secretion protein
MTMMMKILKNKFLWIAAGLCAVIAVLAVSGKNTVLVRIAEVKPGELRVIVNATTTSTVKSENEVTLSAQRTGRVVRLPVREGDRVMAGALIARLDLTEEEVQSESTLLQSKAGFDEAQKNLNRSQGLFDQGMISQQDLDAVRRTYEVAKSQYDAARDDVKVKKEYSIIRAPFSGVVSKKFTEAGELLTTGKQIVTIVDPSLIYVLATIDEVDVGRLKAGLPVGITVDAFPGEKFTGAIKRISPIVSGGKLETRTADVWIYFDRKQPKIKPGMSADVEILVTTLQNVISVPSQAVIEREGKKQVYIVRGSMLKPGDTAVVKLEPVRIGETNWSFTQITSGVQPGDFVVTTPESTGLKNGVKVKIE